MFSPIFAAAGTGKLPIFPLIWSVRPAIAGPVVGTADDTIGTGLLLDEAELAAGELAVDELADGVPAEHAATDKLAAQAVRASAAERYFFIGFLHSVHKSQVPTLNARPTRRAPFGRKAGLTSA
jgi:hypothetical protein